VGKEYNMLTEMGEITLSIVMNIVFGKNLNEYIGDMNYLMPDGSTQKLKFSDYYSRLIKELMDTNMHYKHILFPFMSERDWTKPFRTNKTNIQNLWKVLRSYLKSSKDKNSIFYHISEIQKSTNFITETELFNDLLALLFGGHDTTSHTISSTLYFLRKYPHTEKLLKQELQEYIGASHNKLKQEFTKEKLQKFDYLTQVVKEGLRIDPPGSDTLPYYVFKDTEICGV
jgi:cytochrome P450